MNYPLWLNSDIIYRITTLEGVIKTEEPLRIGKGREEAPASLSGLPVIRIRDVGKGIETPYVPGSSLKGVFRGSAEQICRIYGVKPQVCSSLAKDSCMARNKDESNAITRLIQNGKEDEAMEIFGRIACLVCKLLGTQSYRSKIHFYDAYPFDSSGKPLPISIGNKKGIAIDRSTGAVAHGPYDVEYVSPGSLFTLRITSYNLPNYALWLIMRIIYMINDGYVKLGGFKSRGFGKVTIQGTRLQMIHQSPLSGDSDTLAPLGDELDSSIKVNPTRVEDNTLIFEKERLQELYKVLQEAWEKYAAASRG